MTYIYLIKVFPSNPDNIYKLGRTGRDIIERYNEYKHKTQNPKMVFIYNVYDYKQVERDLLAIFKRKYTLRKDFGNEYFTGDINDMKLTLCKYFIENDKNENEERDENDSVSDNEYDSDDDFKKYEVNTYKEYLKLSNIDKIIITNKTKLTGFLKFKGNYLYTRIWDKKCCDKDAEILSLFLEKNTKDILFNIVNGEIEIEPVYSLNKYIGVFNFDNIVKDICNNCYAKNLSIYVLKYNEYTVNSKHFSYILDTKTFSILDYNTVCDEKIIINKRGFTMDINDTSIIDICIIDDIFKSIVNDVSVVKQFNSICYNILVECNETYVFYDFSNNYCYLTNWFSCLLDKLDIEYKYYKPNISEVLDDLKKSIPRVVIIDNHNDKCLQKIIEQLKIKGVRNIIITNQHHSTSNHYNFNNIENYIDKNKDKILDAILKYNGCDFHNNRDILSLKLYDLFETSSLLQNNLLKWCCKPDYYRKTNDDNPIEFLINLHNTNISYVKYKGEEFKVYKVSDLYEKYKSFCSTNKYKPLSLNQFESKITEKDDYGIKKGIFHHFKAFRIYKIEFEKYIKGFIN